MRRGVRKRSVVMNSLFLSVSRATLPPSDPRPVDFSPPLLGPLSPPLRQESNQLNVSDYPPLSRPCPRRPPLLFPLPPLTCDFTSRRDGTTFIDTLRLGLYIMRSSHLLDLDDVRLDTWLSSEAVAFHGTLTTPTLRQMCGREFLLTAT